jgi:predicted translin family RNA/ssDNA-binding protein
MSRYNEGSLKVKIEQDLMDFLEEHGLKNARVENYNDVSNFVDHIYNLALDSDVADSDEVSTLEDQIDELENDLEYTRSAYDSLKDEAVSEIDRIGKRVAEILENKVKLEDIPNVLENLKKDIDKSKTYIDDQFID